MRTPIFLMVAAAMVLSTTAQGGDVKDEIKMLQGTWTPIAVELGGKKADDAFKGLKLVLEDDKYTVKVGDVSDLGKFVLDPSKKPKTMDIIGIEGPNKGKKLLAIYELTGDTLKVCYALEGQTRPTEFKTAGDAKLFLVTYKREKP